MVTLSILGTGILTGVLMAAAGDPPQPNHPNNTPGPYVVILERAHNAKADDPTSVRALIDSIFNAGAFANMPESVRDRLTRADIAHRKGQGDGITEEDVVAAVNAAASLPAAPSYLRTSLEQVRGYRRIARAMVPFIGSDKGVPKPATHKMSPAEATFLMMALATQKIFNPSFKVAPEKWVAAFEASHNKPKNPVPGHQKPSYTLQAQVFDAETANVLRGLDSDLKDESSVATLGIHLFLDQLGVPRYYKK